MSKKDGEETMEIELILREDIQNLIYTFRGIHVMLDRDLAELFNVETRILNQGVKRNKKRFPEDFCFQLTDIEFNNWKSQIVMSNADKMGLRRPPYAFTEQGVAMLSAILKSDVAIEMSIRIMNAFVAMRRFLLTNARVFQRLDTLEIKQIESEKKIDKVLDAIESREIQPKQGIFYGGQIFDAYQFVSDLIRSAEHSIVIIDNYLDDSVLAQLTKRKENVGVTLFTRRISRALAQDVKKYNEQYPPIDLRELRNAHDRFIIIDKTTVYHFGASLKDLGKKWFAFSKMDIGAAEMLMKLEELGYGK